MLGQVVRGGAATMWRLKARLFQQVLDDQLIFNKKRNSFIFVPSKREGTLFDSEIFDIIFDVDHNDI